VTATDAPPRRTQGLSVTADGRVVPSARRRFAGPFVRPLLTRLDSRAGGWGVTVGITVLAGFLRLWNLGSPRDFLFDETYYAKDSWSLIHHGYALNYVDKANTKILSGHTSGLWTDTPNMAVHPEVGHPGKLAQVTCLPTALDPE